MLTNKEDAMLKPSEHYHVRKLDFEVGDIVQVKRNDSYNGRIGKIIGISISPTKEEFLYTIKFSDKKSFSMLAHYLTFIRTSES